MSIFVFGSNLAGIHGAGAARFAVENHGARYGQGIGYQGNSYAIPTKDFNIRTLPLLAIKGHVDNFINFAFENLDLTFQVTQIGCGLAGYRAKDIAPMFVEAPNNCLFDKDWEHFLPTKQFWSR